MPAQAPIAIRRARARLAIVTAGLVVTGLLGYVGFRTFVTTDSLAGAGLMALAAGTGFAAFFSPCSFPLLLTFLTRGAEGSLRKAVSSSLRVAAGAGILLSILAISVALGSSVVDAAIEFDSTAGRLFRTGVGLFLIAVALNQLQIGRRMKWVDAIARRLTALVQPGRREGPFGDVVYGFTYLLIGFG